MSSAIWTVILHQEGKYSWKVELAARDYKRARRSLSTKHKDHDIVAIILGRHTATHTFNQEECLRNTCYLLGENDNEPTRGSD